MGIRFRKSIKIVKGVNLNVSKSGFGLSVGPRGTKISIGKNGVYSNVGIPGTGISSRQKISLTNNNKSSLHHRGSSSASDEMQKITINISVDDKTGKEDITFEFKDGSKLTDTSVIRKLKRNDKYKLKLQEVRDRVLNESKKDLSALVDIYKNSEEIVSLESTQDEYKKVKLEEYKLKQFLIKGPLLEDFRNEITAEAERNVKSIMFWAIKKLRKKYVKENLNKKYIAELEKWRTQKETFEKDELENQRLENIKFKDEYDKQISYFNNLLDPTDKYIEESFENIISEIQLPLNFSIDFKVQDKNIFLDIDLPEVEDYPITTTKKLASGKISVKKKSSKAISEDYSKSVIGLSYFFASIAFNIAPIIPTVRIAGYTQRLCKSTGNIEDQYVYDILFTRDIFKTLNLENIDPFIGLENFEHKIKRSKSFVLGTIEIE